MRRPRVATLAARSSLPCCCTRAGSDVIRVFIRDVKQASRLGRKGRKDGVVGLHELDQALGKLGILGSQLHQARVWQEIKQQGEELTLGLIHGIWRAETGLWLEQADIPWVPNPCVGWLCLFWDPFIQTQRGTHGHRKQSRRLGSEASVSSPPCFLRPPPRPHLISPGAVTTRLRKMWQQVCRPISTLSGSTEVSWPGDVSSHC